MEQNKLVLCFSTVVPWFFSRFTFEIERETFCSDMDVDDSMVVNSTPELLEVMELASKGCEICWPVSSNFLTDFIDGCLRFCNPFTKGTTNGRCSHPSLSAAVYIDRIFFEPFDEFSHKGKGKRRVVEVPQVPQFPPPGPSGVPNLQLYYPSQVYAPGPATTLRLMDLSSFDKNNPNALPTLLSTTLAIGMEKRLAREARFYGALIRLQQNWNVKRERTLGAASATNEGFYIDLVDNSLNDPATSFRLSSISSTVRIGRDSTGMLTVNLPPKFIPFSSVCVSRSW